MKIQNINQTSFGEIYLIPNKRQFQSLTNTEKLDVVYDMLMVQRNRIQSLESNMNKNSKILTENQQKIQALNYDGITMLYNGFNRDEEKGSYISKLEQMRDLRNSIDIIA